MFRNVSLGKAKFNCCENGIFEERTITAFRGIRNSVVELRDCL